MRKSISLKEFSTTPTVSCMLRKDGNNVAAPEAPVATSVVRGSNVNAQPAASGKTAPPQQNATEQEGMWEME